MSDPFLSVLQISSEVCPQRILISNLPKIDAERLVDQLEIHFSKSKNRGGEVDSCDIMTDSWMVVLKFVNENSEQALFFIFNTDILMEYHYAECYPLKSDGIGDS